MIFDSHAHYDSHQFDEDRFVVLSSMPESNVSGIVNCGCDIPSSEMSLSFADKYPYVYASVGFHPGCVEDYKEGDLDVIKELSRHEKCVAIGEIGLDYHYGKDFKEEQKALFINQLRLANEVKKPVIIHEREAFLDCLEILKAEKPERGVMHCFSGNRETLPLILNLGLYIGVGGTLTFKNNVKTVEMCPLIPKDRILLETDAPYLAPVPLRGKRNHSSYIIHVAERIAELMNMTTEEVLKLTEENAKRFFGI